MKKIIYSFFLAVVTLIIFFVIYLSTVRIETSQFNNTIINEIKKKDNNIQLSLKKIRVKFDIKKIQIYFSTYDPQIVYQGIKVPVKEINLYSKIISILKSKNEINQAIVSLENFSVNDMQKLAVRIKPSNFKNYLLNNINNGKIEKIFIDLKLDDNFKIDNYKVNGSIKEVDISFSNNLLIQDVSLNFISDKNLTLVNSFNAKYKDISISKGSFSIKREKQIVVEGNFNSKFTLNNNSINKLLSKIKLNFLENYKVNIKGSALHNFSLKINENLKLVDYDYKSKGNILDSQIFFKNELKSRFIEKPIKKLLITKGDISINLNKKRDNLLMFDGLYNLGGSENKKIKISHDFNKKNPKYFIDCNLSENIFLELINFKSNFKNASNIKSEIKLINNNIIFDYIKFTEGKNLILINNLKFSKKKKSISVDSIEVKTTNSGVQNNNFKISFKNKISVSGNIFDTTHLLKQFSGTSKKNYLKNYTKDIEINLKNLITKSQIPLKNFSLIGRINKGKFEKLSAKSEFSKTKYLDISLKKDQNNKKILEVYSDLPKALLADYKFFQGIAGGKLLYSSVFDDEGSNTKIIIEDFKVIKAPAFAKLLTLADLGGIADLLSGEGMSFDILEIDMSSDSKVDTVEEILALGPSLSVLMDGYIEKESGLTSLNGTLVPAKTLNKLLSKIPVVGGILVGDKIGDGVFGISFKMKGLPGKVKTTINPVKTLTPRFITRALEKMKKD